MALKNIPSANYVMARLDLTKNLLDFGAYVRLWLDSVTIYSENISTVFCQLAAHGRQLNREKDRQKSSYLQHANSSQ